MIGTEDCNILVIVMLKNLLLNKDFRGSTHWAFDSDGSGALFRQNHFDTWHCPGSECMSQRTVTPTVRKVFGHIVTRNSLSTHSLI